MDKIGKHREITSLSRVWQHTQNTSIGLITAFQWTNKPQVNRGRNSELGAAIWARFGYIKVKGRYVDGYGTPEAHNVDVLSFLVIGKQGPDSGNLLGFLKQQGERYGQDSILFKPHDDENAYLYGTNRDRPDRLPGYRNKHSLGSWHPSRMAEFHTVMFPGETFAFEVAVTPRVYEVIGFYRQITFFSRKEREF